MSSIDNYSKKVWIYFIKKDEVESQTRSNIKCLKIEKGIEYKIGELLKFCEKHGTKRYFTAEEHLHGVGWLRELTKQLGR